MSQNCISIAILDVCMPKKWGGYCLFWRGYVWKTHGSSLKKHGAFSGFAKATELGINPCQICHPDIFKVAIPVSDRNTLSKGHYSESVNSSLSQLNFVDKVLGFFEFNAPLLNPESSVVYYDCCLWWCDIPKTQRHWHKGLWQRVPLRGHWHWWGWA